MRVRADKVRPYDVIRLRGGSDADFQVQESGVAPGVITGFVKFTVRPLDSRGFPVGKMREMAYTRGEMLLVTYRPAGSVKNPEPVDSLSKVTNDLTRLWEKVPYADRHPELTQIVVRLSRLARQSER